MDTAWLAKLGAPKSTAGKGSQARFLTSFLQKWPGGGHENQKWVCVFLHKISMSLLNFGWEKIQAFQTSNLGFKIAAVFMDLIDKMGPCGLLN